MIRRFVKNVTFLLLATFFTNVAAFIWTIYIARYIGAAGFGLLSTALAITNILSIFTDMGLSTYTTREISKYPEKTGNLLANITVLKFFFSIITLVLLYILMIVRGYSLVPMTVTFLIGFYMILTSFSVMFYSIFQGHHRMEYQSIANILNSSILLASILIIIYLKGDIVDISLAYVLTAMITLIYATYTCFTRFVKGFSMDIGQWKRILSEALPFGVTMIFTNIYYWIDSVMLSYMKGDYIVGIYNAPYKFLFVLLSLYNVYMTALFPIMSKFYKDSKEALEVTYQRSLKYMLILTIPLAIIITVFAKEIILFVYGPEYLPGAAALQILTWTIVFLFINGVSSNLLGSIERQATVTKIVGIGALFNVGVNLVLIPHLSFIGASISTVLTELLITLLNYYVVSATRYRIGTPIRLLWRIGLANILMAVTILYFKLYPMLLFIPVLIYFILLYLLGVVDTMDIKLIREVIKPLNLKIKG